MTFIPTETGFWVDENFERLARVIQDYDPQFELRWIPPEHRVSAEEKKKPYVVVDVYTNTAVFYADERDTPSAILTRLFESDNKHGNVLERIEAHNAAIQALELKAQMDWREERADMAAFLIGSNKNYLQLGKGKKVDDQLRPIL